MNKDNKNLDKQFIDIAIIEDEVIPLLGGRCKFNGVYWKCLSLQNISFKEGEIVKVQSINTDLICLIIEPTKISKDS